MLLSLFPALPLTAVSPRENALSPTEVVSLSSAPTRATSLAATDPVSLAQVDSRATNCTREDMGYSKYCGKAIEGYSIEKFVYYVDVCECEAKCAAKADCVGTPQRPPSFPRLTRRFAIHLC